MGKENQFHTVLSVCLLRFKYCTPREKKNKKKNTRTLEGHKFISPGYFVLTLIK